MCIRDRCSKFLGSLNGVRVIPCDNTAAAAKMVAESGSRHAAAISSHPCAALYGLEPVSYTHLDVYKRQQSLKPEAFDALAKKLFKLHEAVKAMEE